MFPEFDRFNAYLVRVHKKECAVFGVNASPIGYTLFYGFIWLLFSAFSLPQ
jgi:hypothetical protein